jgi:hypothetical protein
MLGYLREAGAFWKVVEVHLIDYREAIQSLEIAEK